MKQENTDSDTLSADAIPAATSGPRVLQRLLKSKFGLVAIYLVFLAAYLGASGSRLRRPSPYNHFAYLAQGWLSGSLALTTDPPNENDWARVEILKLQDGSEIKGQFSRRGATDRFIPLSGPSRTVRDDEIVSRRWKRYVSFPPFPAAVMTPLVAIWGLSTNDVILTVVWAAINPVLLFMLLGFLRRKNYSERTPVEDLWLTVMFGAGSVYFFSSVVGQVWYTAHVMATTMVIGYVWASIEGHRPALAGLFVGLGFATRTPLGFMLPLFLLEVIRAEGGWRKLWQTRRLPRRMVLRLLRFAVPAAAILAILLVHNHLRFERWGEFGHKYLNIVWQDRMQRWGLFNYHFMSRNLTAALVLLPRILAKWPYLQVSRHGMSLFLTTPNLGYLVKRGVRSPLAWGLWLSVLATALPHLMYQNSGFVQFGYRFSLDYMIFLVALLAVGNVRMTWVFKLLILLSIPVNLFGAITFDRMTQYTYSDSFFPNGPE